jgi:hypothetical protein
MAARQLCERTTGRPDAPFARFRAAGSRFRGALMAAAASARYAENIQLNRSLHRTTLRRQLSNTPIKLN